MLPDVGPEGALQLTSGSTHLEFQASLGAPSKAKSAGGGAAYRGSGLFQARSLGVELDDTLEAKK